MLARCFMLAALAVAGSAGATDVVAYRTTLTPQFDSRAISGSTDITLRRHKNDAPVVSFPLNGLMLTDVRLDGKTLSFSIENGSLVLPIPQALRRKPELTLSVAYTGKDVQGLVFGPGTVHSVFSTCHWMVCDEDPASKAVIELDLVVPAGIDVVASGEKISEARDAQGMQHHRWRESRPYASYLFGFAAGKFTRVSEMAGANRLEYIGSADDAASLQRKFAPTKAMFAFLRDKAGVDLPHAVYRQVLLPGDAAQEMTSFSVIGTNMLDPILSDPKEDWVIVHEMAHQWWGNLITCKSWRDFWLNEGLTVFMVAAWKQERWGDAAYAAEMALASKRYQHAIDAGFDKPLSFDGAYPTLRIKRAIAYSKGALFIDALRRDIGDAAFWNGLRLYTRANAGKSVVSADFQHAMEQAAGRKLDTLFARWVY